MFAFMRRLDTDLAIPSLANPKRPDPDLATCPIKEAKVNRKRGIVTKCSELLSPAGFAVAFSKKGIRLPESGGPCRESDPPLSARSREQRKLRACVMPRSEVFSRRMLEWNFKIICRNF